MTDLLDREVARLRTAVGEAIRQPGFSAIRSRRRRNTRRRYAVACGLAAVVTLTAGVLAIGTAGGEPPVTRQPSATVTATPVDVIGEPDSFSWTMPSYADPDHGFAVAAHCNDAACEGVVRRTSDGGRTWQDATYPDGPPWPGDEDLPRVWAVAPETAYLWQGRLWVTRDAGATWRAVETHRAGAVVAVRVEGESVWVLASTCSYADSDGTDCVRLLTGTTGGASLALAPVQPARTKDVVLGRSDAAHAWLLDGSWQTEPGRLLATEDGGRTWQQRPLPCRPITSGSLTRDGYPGGLSVTATGAVWLACDGGEPASTLERELFVSTDGGRTWTGGHRLDGKHLTYAALTATTAVAGDGDRGLLRTDDGGETWQMVVPIDGTGGLDVTFVDATHGWARDFSEEAYYVTSDGGRTWQHLGRVSEPTPAPRTEHP